MSRLLPHSTGKETEFCKSEQLGLGPAGSEWDPGHREIRNDVHQNLNFTGDSDSLLCQLSARLSQEGRGKVGSPAHLCPAPGAAEMTRLP